jgi:hypothetical protein
MLSLQVLYHGPREGVMPFFRAHLGFDCPARKGVADFLQEIALPSDQQVGWWVGLWVGGCIANPRCR